VTFPDADILPAADGVVFQELHIALLHLLDSLCGALQAVKLSELYELSELGFRSALLPTCTSVLFWILAATQGRHDSCSPVYCCQVPQSPAIFSL